MIDLGKLRIPGAARLQAEQIIAVTDEVCLEHLDEEYADLCRRLVAKLARKRPSPLVRGDLRIWAAGVVYAIAQVNFLFDPAETPHATVDELSEMLNVKKTTMANKARIIRNAVSLNHLDPEFSRHELVERNPLTWMLQVDGLLVDARSLPLAMQQQAFRLGLIPHVPGLASGDG